MCETLGTDWFVTAGARGSGGRRGGRAVEDGFVAGCGRVRDRGRRAAPVTGGRERVLVVEDDEEQT